MTYSLEFLARPHAVVRHIVRNKLTEFNRAAFMPDLRVEDLAAVIRDEVSREIVGGLWGYTGWDWLTIELIFVPESLRGQGIASRLIGMAEEEALRRGCHSAWLDTLNPDACGLYERLGYERFGELRDFPVGSSRIFLQKKLKSVPVA